MTRDEVEAFRRLVAERQARRVRDDFTDPNVEPYWLETP